jgi:hypothetical protein
MPAQQLTSQREMRTGNRPSSIHINNLRETHIGYACGQF